MDTATCKNRIKAAMLANLSSPTSEQTSAADELAAEITAAVKDMVAGATVTYTTGLVAPPTGGPVTGVSGMTIS